jgi:hemoglobin
MSTIPAQLPVNFIAYGRSPDFSSDNLPAKLRTAHSTKAGTWGLLHVLEGTLRYRLEPPHQGERLVSAGETVVIESEVPHRVEFVMPGRMFVEFYREDTPNAG